MVEDTTDNDLSPAKKSGEKEGKPAKRARAKAADGTPVKRTRAKATDGTPVKRTRAKAADGEPVKRTRAKSAAGDGTPTKPTSRARAKQAAEAQEKLENEAEEAAEAGKTDVSVIKQGSIASFMRKRTQLVGFDTGHFKHVQYAVEFIDNSLDAIESFNWKNTDPEMAYQLETGLESGLDKLVNLENEFMDASTHEVHGLSSEFQNVFSTMGESNGDTAAPPVQTLPIEPLPATTVMPAEEPKPEQKTKLAQITDIDARINSVVDAMEDLISPYFEIVMSEPIIIVRLTEVEDPSLTFLDKKTNNLYCFEIFDSGTGIGQSDLERFGTYLASSKSEKLKQTRGSQGFGSPSAFSDAQNTTGKPIQVISKHYKAEKGYITEFFTTGENKKSYTIETQAVDTDFKHGTYVRLYYANIKYKQGFVDVYVKQTALMNSHVNIIFIDPYKEDHQYLRLANEFPEEPKYAKPHPTSMNIGEFQDMLRTTTYATVKQFLTHSFVRISDKNAANIIANTESDLQDRVGFLELSSKEYITIPEKVDDYIYLLKDEQRVFGKSTKARKKMVIYLLNIAKPDAVEGYKELYRKYKATLKNISRLENELKKLTTERDSAEKKKEKTEISKRIKELEKSKKDEDKNKDTLKNEFLEFTTNFLGSFEEITDEKVEDVILEKYNTFNITDISPKEIQEQQVNILFRYFTAEKYLSPPTDTAIPVGSDVLESVLIQEFGLKISKFDQYFADDEESSVLNDRVTLPAMQKEYKEEAEEGEEDAKYQTLLKLSEEEFITKMASIPLIKFTEFAATIKKELFKECLDFDAEAYRQPSLYAEEIIEEDLDFVSAVTRPPTSGKGLAFVVESAIAYGTNVKTPAKPADVVYRFVNRTPKLRDNADCAIWKTVSMVNWKNYLVDTFDNGIPKAPIRIFINVSGPFVHLMFKSQSKQALAEDENLIKEIKLALEQVGRRLRAYLAKKQKHADSKKRASRFIQFAPHVARAIYNILNKVPEYQGTLVSVDVLEEKIVMGIAGSTPKAVTGAPASKIETAPLVKPKPVQAPTKPSITPSAEIVKQPNIEEVGGKEIKPAKKARAKGVQGPAEQPITGKKAPVQKTLMPGEEAAKPAKTQAERAYPPPAKPAAPAKEEVPMPKASDEIVKITEENILKYMPDGKWVKISYIIKALNIKEITDARFLEVKLKTLMNQGKLERETQDGKSYYKKK